MIRGIRTRVGLDRHAITDERGLTMVELLVYMVLASLVLAMAGGLLINSIFAQRSVGDSAASTNTGQLVSQTVSAATRSAASIRAVSGDPAILLVQVVDDARATPPTAHCEAWALDGDEFRTTRYAGGSAPADDASVGTWLTAIAGDYSTWTLLATGAATHGTDPVFQANGATGVDLTFDVATGRGVTVLIETTATSRQPALAGVTPTCF